MKKLVLLAVIMITASLIYGQILPVKKEFAWKNIATHKDSTFKAIWRTVGQENFQTTTISGIKLKVYTNGFEWIHDDILDLIYGFFSEGRSFMVRNEDDNETIVWIVGNFLAEYIRKNVPEKTAVEITGISGETSGGNMGSRFVIIDDLKAAEFSSMKRYLRTYTTEKKIWWYE